MSDSWMKRQCFWPIDPCRFAFEQPRLVIILCWHSSLRQVQWRVDASSPFKRLVLSTTCHLIVYKFKDQAISYLLVSKKTKQTTNYDTNSNIFPRYARASKRDVSICSAMLSECYFKAWSLDTEHWTQCNQKIFTNLFEEAGVVKFCSYNSWKGTKTQLSIAPT